MGRFQKLPSKTGSRSFRPAMGGSRKKTARTSSSMVPTSSTWDEARTRGTSRWCSTRTHLTASPRSTSGAQSTWRGSQSRGCPFTCMLKRADNWPSTNGGLSTWPSLASTPLVVGEVPQPQPQKGKSRNHRRRQNRRGKAEMIRIKANPRLVVTQSQQLNLLNLRKTRRMLSLRNKKRVGHTTVANVEQGLQISWIISNTRRRNQRKWTIGTSRMPPSSSVQNVGKSLQTWCGIQSTRALVTRQWIQRKMNMQSL